MIFTSADFLLFLLVTVILYYLCPAKFRWIVLLCFSIVFYGIAGIEYLPFILITTLVSYSMARIISNTYKKADEKLKLATSSGDKKKIKADTKATCKKYMLVAVFIILSYLLYTKFALKIWNNISSCESPAFKIIVPLGISYYTFSTIGYDLDIYWKRYSAEKNLFRYLLYVLYFPHILQGPIARYDRLGGQLKIEHRFDYDLVTKGAQLVLIGFFQKLVIADRISPFVTSVYSDVCNFGGAMLLFATFLYAIQLYADFDGCVNIARGVSQIFGIELEENFRRPYFSKSVEEYWRRWHITLGAWFKDYLCMPVSVSKFVKNLTKTVRSKIGDNIGRKTSSICAIVVVWICTGLWHGTGMNYVLWGIWQGGIIIFSLLMDENYAKAKSKFKINDKSAYWKTFQMFRTFILSAIIPRIITRAESLHDATVIFKKILLKPYFLQFFSSQLLECGIDKANMIVVFLAMILWLIIAILKEKGVSIRDSVAKQFIGVRWLIYISFLFVVIIFGVYGPGYDASNFVYMGF